MSFIVKRLYDKETNEWRLDLGRHAWELIHRCVYQIYCKEDARVYETFVCSLVHLYPCTTCKRNIERNNECFGELGGVIHSSTDADVRDNVALWAHALHASVNAFLKKEAWTNEVEGVMILAKLRERWGPPTGDAVEECGE